MKLPLILSLLASVATPAFADDWENVLAAAKGQTVYFNAWGGDERTNSFIAWADQVHGRLFSLRCRNGTDLPACQHADQ